MTTKELVIISGKGGTGKTSIVSSFATLAKNKIMVDCDVDAADLHLILKPEIEKTTEFYSGKTAEIIQNKCIKCGKCIEVCRFEAISKDFIIDEIKCEGCGTCFYQCPAEAIKFEHTKSGEWFESNTRFGKLIHARLGIAEENSGKLVSEIRNYARLLAHRNNNDLIIVDGSPGIGCPVIASISGASLVVVVTEPTLSGLHDAERVLKLAKHFNAPACMCINKFDINLDMTKNIEDFCKKENIEVVGKITYSKDFTSAMIKEQSLIEFSPDGEISEKIKTMWNKLEEKLKG
jgi:MinD superfamily P-loop ATPase